MKVLRICILTLILWNLPTYLLAYFNATLGALASIGTSFLLLFYYFLTKNKHKQLIPFILLGVFYYTIGSLSFSGTNSIQLIKEFIRLMIIIVCSIEILHKTSIKEIYIILLIGCASIIINAVVFPLSNANFYPTYGRFSGFYLNPNFAGTICLIGYSLTYHIKKEWLKIGGQALFTLAGIFTFSRTFILIWLLINILAIFHSKKNIYAPIFGAIFFILILFFSSGLNFNTQRFDAFKSIFSSEKAQTKTLKEDSRTETWSLYTDMILDKPIFGNGYMKFQIVQSGKPGVHNSYLMIIGEAGIIPFLIIVGIYIYLFIKSFIIFKIQPEYFFLTCVLAISLLANHGYFSNYYNIVLSMYVFISLQKNKI